MQDKAMSWIQLAFIVAYEQSLRMDNDLDLWASHMVLLCDISSCHDDQLCKIIYKSHHAWNSYGSDMNSFTKANAQSLSGHCDLDLWPSNMVLVCNTLFCHDAYLCHIIFKSHQAWQSYGLDRNRNRFHWRIWSFSADCDLDLWSSNMVFIYDKLSCHDYPMCQLICL